MADESGQRKLRNLRTASPGRSLTRFFSSQNLIVPVKAISVSFEDSFSTHNQLQQKSQWRKLPACDYE
jgi:hypothetical protein